MNFVLISSAKTKFSMASCYFKYFVFQNGGSNGGLGGLFNDHSHPVILLWDVKADDLRLLFNFMYEGQVRINSGFRSCSHLHI